MTLSLLLILFIAAVILSHNSWHRTAQILHACLLITLFAIGCGPVPNLVLQKLQFAYVLRPDITWKTHNAIVLLGAGLTVIPQTQHTETNVPAYSRIAQAFITYQACKKENSHCTLIITGGETKHNGIAEATVYGAYLQKLGVSRSDLLLEPHSMNTWQNAQFTSTLLKKQSFDRVVLITSGIHLRRSMLYFAHFGIHAIPLRSDYLTPEMSVVPLAYNINVMDYALHEYAGMLQYALYNVLGWNKQATQPGAL